MRSTSAFTKCGQVAALIAAGIALAPSAASACKLSVKPTVARPAPAIAPPVVLDAGYEPPADEGHGVTAGHLWIRIQTPEGPIPHYVLEPVAGHAPRGLPWGSTLVAQNDLLHVPLLHAAERGAHSPFVFGFRVRAVLPGHTGAVSDPTWISFSAAGTAAERDAPRSDQVLFVLLVLGLGLVWYWYRREESAESKIRLAALVALISVIFLSVTSAMPWLTLDGDPAAGRVSCLLGQEGACLFRAGGVATASSIDALTIPSVAYEVQRWQCASAALRMGQVTALALLLPALVWLLVDPRHRAAQAATAVGASVGGFVFLVALLYRHSTPSWLDAELFWTADIALVTASHIVVAAILVVRHSFALLAPAQPLPRASARFR